ncbi:hypothetical protein A7R79_22985 [Pseudomonas aeruginosa]|nr:hypothetical protein A7R79_22985 [Pseudomonas aeruginosa]
MGANLLAPGGREFLGQVEIAQRATVVVRRHGLIHGLVPPLTATALQQITADVAHGLAGSEAWVNAFGFRCHFADRPQHIAPQGVGNDSNVGASLVFRSGQISDQL